MDTGFYVIILVLIFLKLMIWICVFYSRARQRHIMSQRGLIIIRESGDAGRDRDIIINREHLPGFHSGGLDNPVTTDLPSYEEVQRTKSMEVKPPSYEQVIGGGNLFPQGSSGVSAQPCENSVQPSLNNTHPSGYSPQPSGYSPQPSLCHNEADQTATQPNSQA